MKIVIRRQTGPEEEALVELEVPVLNSEVKKTMEEIYATVDARVYHVNERIIKAKQLIKNLVEEYPDEPGKIKRVKGTELMVKFNTLVGELFGILNAGVQFKNTDKEII